MELCTFGKLAERKIASENACRICCVYDKITAVKPGEMNDMSQKVVLQEKELEYKKGFKWYKLSYPEISKAYLRIEEVNGRLCCGVANFDLYYLMLQTKEGELLKLEVPSKELAKEMLEELEVKNPAMEVGYKRPEE